MKFHRKFMKIGFLAVVMALFVVYLTYSDMEKKLWQEISFVREAKCGKFLRDSEIVIENLIWQTFDMAPNISMKLLRAYVDDRRNRTVVRITSIGSQLNYSTDVIYCQFWYKGEFEPTVVKSSAFDYNWNLKAEGEWAIQPDEVAPILIECPFDSETTPFSVSLTAQPCDVATNNLKVIDNNPENGIRKKFGLCSKYLYFDDDTGETLEESQQIIKTIEWVEMVRILGAEQIHIYSEDLPSEFQKVLDKLHDIGRIEILPFRKPKNLENLALNIYANQLFILEDLLLTDCFYRTFKLYEYIAFIDPDEVIIPVQGEDKTWSDLLRNYEPIDKNYWNAYSSINAYFPPNNATPFENIPKYHYMLQNNQRCIIPDNEWTVKSFVIPDKVLTQMQHAPQTCFENDGKCHAFWMPSNVTQLNHYRNKLVWYDGKGGEARFAHPETFLDKTMEKYQTSLVDAVKKTLNEINFIP